MRIIAEEARTHVQWQHKYKLPGALKTRALCLNVYIIKTPEPVCIIFGTLQCCDVLSMYIVLIFVNCFIQNGVTSRKTTAHFRLLKTKIGFLKPSCFLTSV